MPLSSRQNPKHATDIMDVVVFKSAHPGFSIGRWDRISIFIIGVDSTDFVHTRATDSNRAAVYLSMTFSRAKPADTCKPSASRITAVLGPT